MLKALARALALIAGSVAIAAVLVACAIAAAACVMVLGCASAAFGPRGFPWSLLRRS